MAQFKKGQSGNTKGKPKGTLNSKTEQWEIFADYCLNGGLEKFQKEMDSLKGKQFTDALTAILEFHKPKLARSDVNHSGDITIVPPIIKIQPLD
jgi:hypothetical protein